MLPYLKKACLLVLSASLLTGCATQRQLTPTPPAAPRHHAEPALLPELEGYAPDSSGQQQRPRWLAPWRGLVDRRGHPLSSPILDQPTLSDVLEAAGASLPAPEAAAALGLSAGKRGRVKLKGSTIIVQTGTNLRTGQVGNQRLQQSQLSQDSSLLNVAQPGGDIAQALGRGITQHQPPPQVQQAANWKTALASPLGVVLAWALALVLLAVLIRYLWKKLTAKPAA